MLRDGFLEAGATPWPDERAIVDPRPAPSPAMIQEAIRLDQQRLQGTWKVISADVGGRSAGLKQNVRWIIAGSKIVMELGERREGKFSLDASKSPRRIDIVAMASDGKQKADSLLGVYELSGDELRVCLDSGDEPRPASLRSSQDTNQVSLVLQRESAKQAPQLQR